MSDILRVFPRRTKATPTDDLAIIGPPPLDGLLPEFAEVHVSCTFTWDLPEARRLTDAYRATYPDKTVLLGGPALDDCGGSFTPGLYLRPGYTITSRGCPNRCAWCLAAEREGGVRTLPIAEGWDILDNNLLACPERHIRAVLDMLDGQPHPARFTGGLEAARLVAMSWVVRRIARMRLDVVYLAYDHVSRAQVLERVLKMLYEAGGWSAGQGRRKIGCYVLAGFDLADTEASVVERAEWVASLGATPYLMIYRPPTLQKDGRVEALKRSLRRWMRPRSIFAVQTGAKGG